MKIYFNAIKRQINMIMTNFATELLEWSFAVNGRDIKSWYLEWCYVSYLPIDISLNKEQKVEG